MRLSSINITRMTLARSGMSSVMPRLFDAEAVGGFVEKWCEVVHSGHERGALDPVAVFEVLLDAGVQVADSAADLGDRLAFDLQDEPQHARAWRGVAAPCSRRGARPRRCGVFLAAATTWFQSRPPTMTTVSRSYGEIPPPSGGSMGVLISCRPSARRASGSRRRGTPPGCRPTGSPCVADAPPSRRASRCG